MEQEGRKSRSRDVTAAGNPPLDPRIVGAGRTRVKLELRLQGSDLLLMITGGKAHIGAVAVVAVGRSGGKAVINELPGHREGPLAGECAEVMAAATGRTVIVVAGIHQDRATRAEIDAIVANVRQGARELAAAWMDRNEPTERNTP